MSPFDLLCPCCTGALLHTLAQQDVSLLTPKVFLELGKGALVSHFDRSNLSAKGTKLQPDLPPPSVKVPSHQLNATAQRP